MSTERKCEPANPVPRMLGLAACLFGAALIQGCAFVHYYGPEKGRVVEMKEPGKGGPDVPVEGAAVMRVFKRAAGFDSGSDSPVTAQETMTDAEGYYEFPGKLVWAIPSIFPAEFNKEPDTPEVFKPGYGYCRFGGWDCRMRIETTGDARILRFETRRLATLEGRRENVQYGVGDVVRWKCPRFWQLIYNESRAVGLAIE